SSVARGRTRLDGILGGDRARRQRPRVEVLRHEPGDFGATRRAVRRRAQAALEQVLRRRAVQRDGRQRDVRSRRGALGRRSQRGRRRRQRHEQAHRHRVVVLGPHRQERRRWPGEPCRVDCARRQLAVPAAANGSRAELRAVDALRHLRVRQHLPVLQITMTHYLSYILFEPLVGALLILLVSKQNENAIKWIANLTAFAGFIISIPLWFWYNPSNAEFQLVERAPWIPSVGADYFLGVDGLSVLLILLTTMMGFIAVLSSWTAITERVKEYYIFLLVLQTGMLGAFMSLDFLLFFLFWEVMLVPMYFLIGIWGSLNRLYSAIKFFLYTLVGSVVMLLGILALYFYNHELTGVYTFDVTTFHKLAVPYNLQWWIFLAFFLGFAIKVPMFPFHTWLPDAHTDAPTAGSVILAAVLLKMGTYGFLRFSLPILPDASRHF